MGKGLYTTCMNNTYREFGTYLERELYTRFAVASGSQVKAIPYIKVYHILHLIYEFQSYPLLGGGIGRAITVLRQIGQVLANSNDSHFNITVNRATKT